MPIRRLWGSSSFIADTIEALRLESLLAELSAIRQAMERQGEETRELRAQLTLPAPSGDLEALKRRNTYLEGELRRRDLEAEKPVWSWWKVWGRRS